MESNDLTLSTGSGVLNIRVLLLIETPRGFIFEKHENGYYFAIGGRVKFNETSFDAAKRELEEEINNVDIKLEFRGLVENFFTFKGEKTHEINFIYHGNLNEELDLSKLDSGHAGFEYIDPTKVNELDIRPKILKEILGSSSQFQHSINID